MSGSGGTYGYEPPARIQFDCESGTITVNLSSVDLTVLAKHSIGQILEIEIGRTGALVLINGNGEILGSIAHVNTADIIQCINTGNNYVGQIINITPPVCRVIVRRV